MAVDQSQMLTRVPGYKESQTFLADVIFGRLPASLPSPESSRSVAKHSRWSAEKRFATLHSARWERKKEGAAPPLPVSCGSTIFRDMFWRMRSRRFNVVASLGIGERRRRRLSH